MFKHNDPIIQGLLNELFAEREGTDKAKIKSLKRQLRNVGVLSLPFTLNKKRIENDKATRATSN